MYFLLCSAIPALLHAHTLHSQHVVPDQKFYQHPLQFNQHIVISFLGRREVPCDKYTVAYTLHSCNGYPPNTALRTLKCRILRIKGTAFSGSPLHILQL